jgi:hypothetical protein
MRKRKPTRVANAKAISSFAERPLDSDSAWNADDIEEVCRAQFNAGNNKTQCNYLVRAVADVLIAQPPFGEGDLADAIIEKLGNAEDWDKLNQDHAEAIRRVADAYLVIAGMTSEQIYGPPKPGDPPKHGHVAIAVTGTEYSGTAKVTFAKCYAGSDSAGARVPRDGTTQTRGLAWSFPADKAARISYWAQRPDKPKLPSLALFSGAATTLSATDVVEKVVGIFGGGIGSGDKFFKDGIEYINVKVTAAGATLDLTVAGPKGRQAREEA